MNPLMVLCIAAVEARGGTPYQTKMLYDQLAVWYGNGPQNPDIMYIHSQIDVACAAMGLPRRP